MANETLKILIASAPKTGNTWVRTILAELFELPVVALDVPFSRTAAEQLGPRWIAHQHFVPTPAILDWARETDVHLITTLRHPGDLLVSLYHYVRNFPETFQRDVGLARALASENGEPATEGPINDGPLISLLLNRLPADLAKSSSWIFHGVPAVRYEEMLEDPAAVVRRIAGGFGDFSDETLQRAIERCSFSRLKQTGEWHEKFYRKGRSGEWKTALPAGVVRQFGEEPFRSQLAFLGYEMSGETPPSAVDTTAPIFEAVFDEFRQSGWELSVAAASEQAFFQWLNAPADDDPTPNEVPLLTNLAAFIHRRRPDLQAAFPNPFRDDRAAYADWFLRYAKEEFALDRAFLVPTALSWIRK